MKNNDIRMIAGEYKQKLSEILGNQLAGVLLYGSQSRGTSNEFSDIDILCVMRTPFDYADMIGKTSEITAQISLNYDVVLSRVFVSEQNFKTGGSPFIMNVRKEGQAI